MKFRVMLMTGLLPLGLGLAGCAAIGEKPESEAAAELLPAAPQPEAKAIASAYVTGLAEAIEQDDFAKLKAVIPRESKDKVTEEMFKQMAGELSEGLGTLKKTEYLGELNQSVVMDYIWKFTFEKMSADKDGKSRNLCKEVLYMVRMGRVDGRFVIVGSGFRF